jgi:hypothetical protein
LINQFDYREWLLQHGATNTSVQSRFLSGIYDFVFACRDGDKKRPAGASFAAGVAVRMAMRMFFTYRGSMFWRIRSGMGDAVFAPLYKVLLRPDRKSKIKEGETRTVSPVQFHFLHELDKVCFDVASNRKRYVKTWGDAHELDRLSASALDNSGCWPDFPNRRFARVLEQGNSIRKLNRGKDFDGVIFAMGIDAFKKACADAMRATLSEEEFHPWATMCDEVKTVATKSAQVPTPRREKLFGLA